MPYRTRAFCTGDQVPTLNEVFDYARSKGVELHCDETHGSSDPNNKISQNEILYKEGKMPFVIECDIDDGIKTCLVREEINEFIEEIGSPRLSLAKRKVIKHLKATKFIISSQLLNDIDDDGHKANWTFLQYFEENCGGLLQADLEGFYKGNRIILKIS